MKSKQMALCGLLTALAVVCMVLASAIGIGTFAGPLLAMIALLPLLEEYGPKTALAAYVAAAILGFLIAPELELSLVYAAFGWYPVLRPRLNRLASRPARLLLKTVICVAVILLLYGVLLNLLGMTADLEETVQALRYLLMALGVITFLTIDVALEHFTLLWHRRFRRYFFKP